MADPKVVEHLQELARAAVADIVADLTDRRGFPEDFDTGSDWAEARTKMAERIEWALMRATELRGEKTLFAAQQAVITEGMARDTAERRVAELEAELDAATTRGRELIDAAELEAVAAERARDEAVRRAEAAEYVVRTIANLDTEGDDLEGGVTYAITLWDPADVYASLANCIVKSREVLATLTKGGAIPVCPTCNGLGYAKAPNGDTGPCECAAKTRGGAK